MTCGDENFRDAAGPYLLGALDPTERAAFAEHLARCGRCRDEVDLLRPAVAALAALTTADVERMQHERSPRSARPSSAERPDDARGAADSAGPPVAAAVPETLLPGLLARAARRERRRKLMLGGIGGIAAAAVIALAVVLGTGLSRPSPAPEVAGQVLTMRSMDGGALQATATVTGKPWGTAITLHCHYEGGDWPGSGSSPYGRPVYVLQVTDTDGSVHDLGSWGVSSNRDTVFTGGTALPPDKIGRIEVLGTDGTPVLTAAG